MPRLGKLDSRYRAEQERVRYLKEYDVLEYCRERRRRRQLRKRFIGFTKETREYLADIILHPCVYCGGITNTIDHVVPRSKRGSNHWWNLVPACGSCNNRKGNKDLDEFLREL